MQLYFWLFYVCVTAMADEARTELPKVVVLSVGGFRWEYLKPSVYNLAPVSDLKNLIDKSASPAHLKPVFPTKTSVNLFSVATGLYAEQHGVISECPYDEPNAEQCTYEQYDRIKSITPLWIENEIQGGTSGVMDWPGYQKEYKNRYPTYHQGYIKSNKPDYSDLVDIIFGWLENGEKPANLVMAHFGDLDRANHENSALSTEVFKVLRKINAMVKYFTDELERKRKIYDINVIILGSHGSKSLWPERSVDLEDILIYPNKCPFIGMGGNVIVFPAQEQFDSVYGILSIKSAERYSVYKKEDILEKWHIKSLDVFTENILLVASIDHYFWNPYLTKILNTKLDGVSENNIPEKTHFGISVDGYSNDVEIMQTFFVAFGPSFITPKSVNPFQTIDVHPLLRVLLGFKGDISELQRQTEMNKEVKRLLIPSISNIVESSENDVKTVADKKNHTWTPNFFRNLNHKVFGPKEKV